MPSLKRSKPKTVTDRVKAASSAAGDAGKAVGNAASAAGEVVAEGAKTVRDRAVATTKSAPSGLETTRGKVVAGVGAAGAAAGAVAFWKKSQQGGEPDVTVDPSEREPTSVTTTETPEAKAAKEAAPTGGSS
jgi:hypothetical protein